MRKIIEHVRSVIQRIFAEGETSKQDAYPGKTGAVVCKKEILGTEEMEYKALLFISDIPANINNAQLEWRLQKIIAALPKKGCAQIIVRADVNAASNEVSEQFH